MNEESLVPTRGKTAFVLSGGGAKGAFQVGVLKQLTEKGIVPSSIFGSSVGALNATGMAYANVKRLEDVWLAIERNSDIIKFQVGTVFFSTLGLYSIEPLHKLIKKFVGSYIPNAIRPVACVNQIYTGEIVYMNPYTCHAYGLTFDEAVLASAAIPLAMEPVNKIWVDGGVRETVPLRVAIEEGFDTIYVVLSNPYQRNPEPGEDIKNWLCMGARAIELLTHEIFINDIKTCLKCNHDPDKRSIDIHVYAPDAQVSGTLEFDPKKIRQGIDMGYKAKEISRETIQRV